MPVGVANRGTRRLALVLLGLAWLAFVFPVFGGKVHFPTDFGYPYFKAPAHAFHLPSYFKAYPDARVIVTHRDPAKAVPSTMSFVSAFGSLPIAPRRLMSGDAGSTWRCVAGRCDVFLSRAS